MRERVIPVPGAGSDIETFVCAPERGGPHPALIFYMDGFGVREELRDMVRRLAAVGYVVLLPDLYHRLGPGDEPSEEPPMERMLRRMRTLSNALVVDDTRALLAWLDTEPQVRLGPIGAVGYCMSGQFVLSAVGTFPDRFAAAAAFYGVGMATDAPDSPHLLAPAFTAELYLGCAGEDPYVPPAVVARLDAALKAARCGYEIELYPGEHHGFAFPQREAYRREAAERHWERTHALFRRTLGV